MPSDWFGESPAIDDDVVVAEYPDALQELNSALDDLTAAPCYSTEMPLVEAAAYVELDGEDGVVEEIADDEILKIVQPQECDDLDDDHAVDTVAVGANITKQRALELAVELSEFVSSHVEFVSSHGEYGIDCCVELSALKDTLQKQIFQGRRQTTVTQLSLIHI